MARFFDGIKIIKYAGKLALRLQKLQEPLAELRGAGKLPESLQRFWEISGIEEGSTAPECPKDQPAIADNTMWYLVDLVRELEKNAPLFDAEYHDAIAECVGVAEMFEKFLREESDPKELKKWEKKNGRTYEGPTEREKYYVGLQEEAAAVAEAELKPEAAAASEEEREGAAQPQSAIEADAE